MTELIHDPKIKFAAGLIFSVLAIILTFLASNGRTELVQNITENPQILGVSAPVLTRDLSLVEELPVIPEPKLVTPLDLSGISAKSFLVYDATTGTDLAFQETNLPLPIASVTKLLSAYTAYQKISLRETATITAKDQIDISPILGLQIGDEVATQDLFNSMLVGSANDAAQALANYVQRISGEKFVKLMNDQAALLKMTDSHFSNPLGFDSETNYSTASDVKKLVEATRNYSAFSLNSRSNAYKFRSENGNAYYVKATNKLITIDKEISAIKTGYTDEALGAMVTEITHQGHSFIIIVLASPDREGDTLELKKQILKSYSWD